MAQTLEPIEGVTEEMLDKLAALGIISVFDVEEIGEELLVDQIGASEELAAAIVEASSSEAKIVAEEQAKEKAEAEKRKAEEETAARALLEGGPMDADADAGAASILGEEAPAPDAAPSIQTTDPQNLENIASDQATNAGAGADAVLSGAEPVSGDAMTPDQDPPPADNPTDAADENAAKAPEPSADDQDITGAAVHEVVSKQSHTPSTTDQGN